MAKRDAQMDLFGVSARDLSRREDPSTSKQAARGLIDDGKLGNAMKIALHFVRRYPGSTASELDSLHGTEWGAVRKRLNDLRKVGLAYTKGTRRCNVTRRSAQIWYPTER